MVILVTILVLLFIVFFPIRIKIIGKYSKDDYYLKLYNFTLISKEKNIFTKLINKYKTKSAPSEEVTTKKTRGRKLRTNKKKYSFSVSKILNNLYTNKFKVSFSLIGDFNYDLEDAAKTAISYGALNSLLPYLLLLFKSFFKVKKFNLNIIPLFKSENLINTEITCIISFNLAKIIYMLFLVLKSREKIEED